RNPYSQAVVMDSGLPRCARAPESRRRELLRRVSAPLADGGRQHVEVWAHEEGFPFARAEVTIIGVDHGANLGDATRHRIHDEIAEISVALTEARIRIHRAGNAFGRGSHQWLHRRALLLHGH